MLAFLDQDALQNDPPTARRIEVAVYNAAAAVFGEDPATTDHTVRLAWATRALTGDGVTNQRVMHYLITRPDPTTILATDAALLTFVNGLVTALAKLPA